VTTSSPEAPDLETYAARVAEAAGGSVSVQHGTVKVKVAPGAWVEALTAARDELGLVFFSWLSAVEWTNEVAIGDPLVDDVEERVELLATVADLSDGRRVTFSTDLDAEHPAADSLVGVYRGANWHEREAAEMFGVDFRGHPGLDHLYLPDGFIGHPLRKAYALRSREVKPWPGKVDVEAMPDSPTTANPER
jgi:NADH:ubiquinone oxidoreductase subunit C